MSNQKKNRSHHGFTYILLLILTPLLFLSFASQEFSQRQKKSNLVLENQFNDLTGLTYLQCVKMDKTIVDTYLQGGAGRKRVILELSSNNITTADPTFKVHSYLAKSHKQHGIGVTPDELQAIGNCFTFQADTKYIIGNNYVTVKKLKDFIESLVSPNYTYLKFTPIVTSTNHIAFKFAAYLVVDNKETLINLKKEGLSGFNETNPSPPADPKG